MGRSSAFIRDFDCCEDRKCSAVELNNEEKRQTPNDMRPINCYSLLRYCIVIALDLAPTRQDRQTYFRKTTIIELGLFSYPFRPFY